MLIAGHLIGTSRLLRTRYECEDFGAKDQLKAKTTAIRAKNHKGLVSLRVLVETCLNTNMIVLVDVSKVCLLHKLRLSAFILI